MSEGGREAASSVPIPSTAHNRNDQAYLDSSSLPASEISRDLLTVEKTPIGVSDGGEAGGESADARIERLGRERPEKFKSMWAEVGFCFSIVMSQVLTVRISFPHRDFETRADNTSRSILCPAFL